MSITLYEGVISPNARKVRLVAAELGIPIERVRLKLDATELRTPEYLAKNPNGKVPTLDDDGFVLWESGAILGYLAAKRPERGLVPADPKARALVEQWLLWWTSHPESALWRLVVERRIKPRLGKPGDDPTLVAQAESELARFLPILNQQLADKDYIVGGLSLVDFAVAPWLEAVAPMKEVNLDRYEHIHRWLARMQARPYWKEC
jgi:glutathione S-transferase